MARLVIAGVGPQTALRHQAAAYYRLAAAISRNLSIIIDNLREQFDKSENARILAEKEAATWRARYETLKEAMERFMQPQPAAQAQTHTAQKTQKNELAERNNRFRSGWTEFHRENPKASMHDFYMTLENPGVSYTRIREILREQD